MSDLIELVVEVIMQCTHFDKLPKLLRWIALIVVVLVSMIAVLSFIYFGLTMKNNLVLVLFLFFAALISYFTRKLVIDAITLINGNK